MVGLVPKEYQNELAKSKLDLLVADAVIYTLIEPY